MKKMQAIRQKMVAELELTERLLRQEQRQLTHEEQDEGFVPPPTHGQDDEAERVAQLELVYARQGSLQEHAQSLRQALARLDDGSYGNCTGCGNAIESARLTFNPSVSFCISCQRKREELGQ